MPIANGHVMNTRTQYEELRLELFKQWESDENELYFDDATLLAHPTIGIGLNLDEQSVLDSVLDKMGITDQRHRIRLTDILLDGHLRAPASRQ